MAKTKKKEETIDLSKHSKVKDEQLNQAEENVQEDIGAEAPQLEDQIENISPLVQETADLQTASAAVKTKSPADVRATIAKARMTSPKKANRGASATNPLGRGGYDG